MFLSIGSLTIAVVSARRWATERPKTCKPNTTAARAARKKGLFGVGQSCAIAPLNFDDTFLTVLTDENGEQREAIEVVQDKDGQYYIAGYGGPGGGIWVAKLNWR